MALYQRDLAAAQPSDERCQKILSCLPYVITLARQYYRRGFDLLDLIQQGNLIAVECAGHHDPERGTMMTLVGRSVQRELHAYVRQHGSVVYEPKKRSPAAPPRLTQQHFDSFAELHQWFLSRDDPYEQAAERDEQEEGQRRVQRLDERKREIIERRAKGELLRDIGKSLGLTRERVRQLERDAICECQQKHQNKRPPG